jgi:hypothetical protein
MRGLTYLETGIWAAQNPAPQACTRDQFIVELSAPDSVHNVVAGHIFAANFEAVLDSGYYGRYTVGSSWANRRDTIISAFRQVLQSQLQAQKSNITRNQGQQSDRRDVQNRQNARRIAVSDEIRASLQYHLPSIEVAPTCGYFFLFESQVTNKSFQRDGSRWL